MGSSKRMMKWNLSGSLPLVSQILQNRDLVFSRVKKESQHTYSLRLPGCWDGKGKIIKSNKKITAETSRSENISGSDLFHLQKWSAGPVLLSLILTMMENSGQEAKCTDTAVESLKRTFLKTLCVLVTQSGLTFCNPMEYSPPGSSVHRILQATVLEWVAIPFSRDQTWVFYVAGGFFTIWATRKAHLQQLIQKLGKCI